MRRAWSMLLVVLAVAGTVNAKDQGQYELALRAYREFVRQQMAMDGIPGLSVGFCKDDFKWAEGFGYADVENGTPATPHTSYRLASVTKSMTAVAILQLAERGLVDLDAEVQRYVPYFPRKPWPITVRQLLGHLGGISHYRNYEVEGRIKEHKDTRDAIAIFAEFDLVAEPGTRYHYSSYGYNLLGGVIEGAAKQRYGDHLRTHLWHPLGMVNTRMDDPEEVIPNRARGYRLVEGQLRNSEFVDVSSRFAAGGTRSTVLDLLEYARGLESGKVLSPESIEAMYTSMVTRGGHYTDYGMGWVVRPFNGHFCVYHTGGQPETRTLLLLLPRLNFALALAYNFEGGDPFAYADRLIQLLFDERRARAYLASPADRAVYKALEEIFDYGLAYFERYGRPVTADSVSLVQAFDYIRRWVCLDSLRRNYQGTRRKLQEGRHPVAGEPFVVVGSHMGQVLATRYGSKVLSRYHREGPLPFFADYARACGSRPGSSNLPPELVQLVRAWAEEWARTWTPVVRQLVIAPFVDLKGLEGNLRKYFSGARVYPDFTVELGRVVEYHALRGQAGEATRAAQLAVELYPGVARPWLLKCLAELCSAEAAKAQESLRHAEDRDREGDVVTPSALNGMAARLAEAGKLAEALTFLEIAIAEYPGEAALREGLAELHLRRARGYLRKAIELDPTLESAWERLQRVR
ncbi:MAG: serine hydrolase [Calditrichaeota bacterium]|nr:serine hydrolase [Calditrichota bacterium]